MSFKNVDIENAMRRLADMRIEEAMREGKFDNLAGMGEPLDLEPMPAEENARMTWWALKLLRQNNFTPDEVRWRKAIDHLKARLAAAADEPAVCRIVGEINDLVHKINTLGTNALPSGVVPLCEETERQRFRDALGQATEVARELE